MSEASRVRPNVFRMDGRQHDTDSSRFVGSKFGGGNGGGSEVDSETKNYLDRSVDAVKAQNDARFAEVIAKLDAMNPVTWWQNALLLLAGIGSVIALLSFGSGRFDSGVGSMGAVIDSINAQREVNNAQDQRLERILDILGKQADAD